MTLSDKLSYKLNEIDPRDGYSVIDLNSFMAEGRMKAPPDGFYVTDHSHGRGEGVYGRSDTVMFVVNILMDMLTRKRFSVFMLAWLPGNTVSIMPMRSFHNIESAFEFSKANGMHVYDCNGKVATL